MKAKHSIFLIITVFYIATPNLLSAQSIIGKKITYSIRNIPKVTHFVSPETVLSYDRNSDCKGPNGGGKFGAVAKLNGMKLSNVVCTFKTNGDKANYKVTATGNYTGNSFTLSQRWKSRDLNSNMVTSVRINGSRCSGTQKMIVKFKNRTTRDNQSLKNCRIR